MNINLKQKLDALIDEIINDKYCDMINEMNKLRNQVSYYQKKYNEKKEELDRMSNAMYPF